LARFCERRCSSQQFNGAAMSKTILSDGKKYAPGAEADRIHDC
jgi:hypothetical protein